VLSSLAILLVAIRMEISSTRLLFRGALVSPSLSLSLRDLNFAPASRKDKANGKDLFLLNNSHSRSHHSNNLTT
jgi:hypothetical protein